MAVQPVATPNIDAEGNRVTQETAQHQGQTYNVLTTEHKVNWRGRLWRGLVSPATFIAWCCTKIGGAESTQNEVWDKGLKSIWEGSFSTKKWDDLPDPSININDKYGVDVTKQKAIQDEIELAQQQGRLLRQGNHQYIFLKNSAAIIIPNGDRSIAYARNFWSRGSGKGFDNTETLERVVKCFLMGYDAIEREGGDLDVLLVFDLDCKRVRGFSRKPGPNISLDAVGMADRFYDLESSLMDQMRALWDPDKVDSKIPLQGTKVDASGPRPKEKLNAAANKANNAAGPVLSLSPREEDSRWGYKRGLNQMDPMDSRRRSNSPHWDEKSPGNSGPTPVVSRPTRAKIEVMDEDDDFEPVASLSATVAAIPSPSEPFKATNLDTLD